MNNTALDLIKGVLHFNDHCLIVGKFEERLSPQLCLKSDLIKRLSNELNAKDAKENAKDGKEILFAGLCEELRALCVE